VIWEANKYYQRPTRKRPDSQSKTYSLQTCEWLFYVKVLKCKFPYLSGSKSNEQLTLCWCGMCWLCPYVRSRVSLRQWARQISPHPSTTSEQQQKYFKLWETETRKDVGLVGSDFSTPPCGGPWTPMILCTPPNHAFQMNPIGGCWHPPTGSPLGWQFNTPPEGVHF